MKIINNQIFQLKLLNNSIIENAEDDDDGILDEEKIDSGFWGGWEIELFVWNTPLKFCR